MSLDAVERQGMPFRGETGGIGIGREPDDESGGAGPARGRFGLPSEADDLAERVRRARREAALHADHDAPRAPRPERMQR
jgi:hypothetical protein